MNILRVDDITIVILCHVSESSANLGHQHDVYSLQHWSAQLSTQTPLLWPFKRHELTSNSLSSGIGRSARSTRMGTPDPEFNPAY